MLSKIDQELSFVKTAMSLRGQRQEILAANLANADTPNYKAKDIDFKAALQSARAGQGSLSLARTSARHIAGAGDAGAASGHIKYRAAVQPSLDGNTVDVNVERAQFTENALHYQFLMDRATSSINTLRTAIKPEGN